MGDWCLEGEKGSEADLEVMPEDSQGGFGLYWDAGAVKHNELLHCAAREEAIDEFENVVSPVWYMLKADWTGFMQLRVRTCKTVAVKPYVLFLLIFLAR